MSSRIFVGVLLQAWINVALGNDESKLFIEQQDELDDLYLQTQSAAAPQTPDYKMVPNVCEQVKRTDSFRMLTQNESFRSTVRGPLIEVENPPIYVTEFGSRRYELTTNNSLVPLIVDLYTCTDDNSSRKYLLSHGYKRDSIFFLFVFDGNTNVAELSGLVRRDSAADSSSKIDIQATEIEKQPAKSNVGIDLLKNPLCNLNQLYRIKVCLLLVNTPYYRNKYILSPVLANFDPQCKRISLEKKSAHDRTEEFDALPCWVRPVSNPWIKIINLPDAPNKPLYISVDYGSLQIRTFSTVLEGDEIDIVKFDANLKDLLTKDLFWIFEEMATKVKQAYQYMKSRRQDSGHDHDKNRIEYIESNDGSGSVPVKGNVMDVGV